jgi:tRNA G18 (ribose-2'-O)-methylase SpoU
MQQTVDSLDDPRVDAYRNMKDRELARDGGRFIAEGEQVVRRLLASGIGVESVLLSQRKANTVGPIVPPDIPVWIASDETIESVIGFEFHSGVMACGIRPPPIHFEQVLQRDGEQTVAVCPKITNVENLGSLVRLCAGFGVTALVLGNQCCDPFFRQSVRVSMGSVFTLPMVRLNDEESELIRLKQEWGFELVATVLDASAQSLAEAKRTPKTALLFGGEADGLERRHIELCDRRVTIPMRRNTDSLNVAIAAGIFLYHFVDVCGVNSTR